MTFEIEISQEELNAMGMHVQSQLWSLKSNAQLAMAMALQDVVFANFGQTGIDRPEPWAPLSPRYAKKVGRTFATLEVSGDLKNQVRIDDTDLDKTRVYANNSEVPYVLAHQFGYEQNNLPARPFFPITADGELTDFSQREIHAAALKSIEEDLR